MCSFHSACSAAHRDLRASEQPGHLPTPPRGAVNLSHGAGPASTGPTGARFHRAPRPQGPQGPASTGPTGARFHRAHRAPHPQSPQGPASTGPTGARFHRGQLSQGPASTEPTGPRFHRARQELTLTPKPMSQIPPRKAPATHLTVKDLLTSHTYFICMSNFRKGDASCVLGSDTNAE